MDQLKVEQGARQVKLLFSDFIAYLHRQGFIIGIDHHLRLQALLNKMGPGCKPADLKLLLCPIFATSKKQQQQFYRAFDAYFLPLEPGIKEPARRFGLKKNKGEPGSAPREDNATPGQRGIRRKRKSGDEEHLRVPHRVSFIVLGILLVLLVAWLSAPDDSVSSTMQSVSSGHASGCGTLLLEHIQDLPIDISSKSREEIYEVGKEESSAEKADYIDITDHTVPDDPILRKFKLYRLAQEWARKIDELNRSRFEPRPQQKPGFYQRYGGMIRSLGIFIPIIIFFILEAYYRSRRRLLLESRKGKKPPYIWPIKVETPEPALVKNARFYDAARILRERLESNVQRLDIDKTINRTIEKAGYPDFRYRSVTRPPEYLILIDWPAYRDHFPYLFDSFSRALEDEGLFVQRYFYDKDPRVCFKEIDGERIYLSDLKARTSDHRLIIFGACDALLDPVSGQPDRWTSMFNAWKERTLLTVVQPKLWGAREVALARSFIVLPATIEGLNAVKNHFHMRIRPDLKAWKQTDDLPLPPINYEEYEYSEENFDDDDIYDLETYLGHDVFQWLCACAVYPEIHWDLTLFLGSLGCMPVSLISERNVLRLIRLPWFRTGKMPDELRRQLIKKLDPAIGNAVRQAIINLLEKNPAPKGSLAHDNYRLHLVLQKWMMSGKSRKERKKLIRDLKELSEQNIIRDYTQLDLRDTDALPESGLHFSLPKRMQKIFYRKGAPVLGFKTWLRLAFAIVISITCSILFQAPKPMESQRADKIINPFPEIVALEGGGFYMGSDPGPETGAANERPRHEVTIQPFAMGKYEVTNAQFVEFINTDNAMSRDHAEMFTSYTSYIKIIENDKKSNGFELEVPEGYENYPVDGVTWEEARRYCVWLEQKTGFPFRLPTEAEWEYACRAGTDSLYSFGDSERGAFNYGWFLDNTNLEGPREAGLKSPNDFGLYDLHGNLWEWCLDGWTSNYNNSLEDGMAINPEDDEKRRAVRGGAYQYPVKKARSALRHFDEMDPGTDVKFIGFRVAASLKTGYPEVKPEESFDPALWESNHQKVGYFVVLLSIETEKGLPFAVDEVERLRRIPNEKVQLYYTTNEYYAAVIGPFDSEETAEEKSDQLQSLNPRPFYEKAIYFTHKYKKLADYSPVQDQPRTDSAMDESELADAIIKHAFRAILNRPPDSRDSKLYYMRRVVDKKVLTLCKNLFGHPEFEKRLNSSTPEDIAIYLYQIILERDPYESEITEARTMIKDGTFYEKVTELLLSHDFRKRFEGPKRPAQLTADN